MSEPFIGEIRQFPYSFAPAGWAACDGSTLSIDQNSALFSLIGTTYGGDGVSTFKLPDLRGRIPTHVGQRPGSFSYPIGELGGQEAVALTPGNLAPHNHPVGAFPSDATLGSPKGNFPAQVANGFENVSNATMAPSMIGTTGGGQPLATQSPFQVYMFCIALEGIYPSRA